MARSKIISVLIFFFFLTSYLKSQGLYVPYNHPVYSFLERMEAAQIIELYSNETKPLLRSKVVKYLSEIYDKRNLLDESEKRFLNYFINEFYFDLTGRLNRYDILINGDGYDLFNDKEKFIYAYSKENEFFLFLKSHVNISSITSKDSNPAHFIEGGGRIYGSFSNTLGFELDGTNGYLWGSKSTALKISEHSYNFKLNEKTDSKFFDKSYSYISIEFPFINLSLGKNRQTIGYGFNKLILDENSPEFEKINLNLNYKSFGLEFTHGWLQKSRLQNDSSGLNKYFAHHRLSFSPSPKMKFGIGEAIIYKRTSPELSYLNPFNFYKSIEHQLQDQDNAILYFDLEYLVTKNLRLYSTFLIDDIDFARIGSGWYGNKTAFNIGANVYSSIWQIPTKLYFEFTRIEPYTFTHRVNELNYTNFGFPLATEQPPNSLRIDAGANVFVNPKFSFNLNYAFTRWGRNYEENSQIVNVGGDINYGKKPTDSDFVKFLDGRIENIHKFDFYLSYEFIRNIKFLSKFEYTRIRSKTSSLILTIGLISFL
jgi:hypothetical protein